MDAGRTSRRNFFCRAGLGALALALDGSLPDVSGAQDNKFNVLFIAIDDLNDWAGCLGGHPGVHSPNIDRLASTGVLFTNAHCAAPLCNPSRAALMTGIRPSTSGVYDNSEHMLDSPVSAEATTLPAHFRSHGYRTLGSGKIYHGACPDPEAWHDYSPSKTEIRHPDPMPANRPLNGIPDTRHFDWGPVDVPDNEMGDWKVADWVSRQIKQNHRQPFFLACGFFRPHLPWYVPKKYFDLYPLDQVVLPEVKPDDLEDVQMFARRIANPSGDHARVTGHAQWREAVRGYLASISFVDDCVGRVINALDASPHRDNTIVVLWADHGWHLGEKLHWRKFTLWEEATRNILFFRAPGLTSSRNFCNSPVSLLDIYPTLVELCGLSPIKTLEGNSLVTLLKDPASGWEAPALTTYGLNNHSVRSQDWRYTRYHDGTEELYDHRSDRHEWFNQADNPAYVNVKQDLSHWLPRVNVPSVSSRLNKQSLTEKIYSREP
jgi:arylsulfatase A-like enzyme